MGIAEIFTDQADLSGLLKSNERIKVKKVIHKVRIDINEEHDEHVERKLFYFCLHFVLLVEIMHF